MDFLNKIKRIERIDYLIRLRSTGSPVQLAKRLNLSPSQVYQILKIMKDEMGAPIYYSKTIQSYCYRESVRFICAFELTESNK